jgi:hypothetical protein
MRSLLILASAVAFCASIQPGWTQDQLRTSTVERRMRPEEPCTSFPKQDVPSHELPVIGVSFSGNLRMPIAEQSQISAELKQLSYSEPPSGATEELLEKVRVAWQDRGYFQAEVNGNAILASRGGAERGLALSLHINEGPQYRLGGIAFQGNKALPNAERLRSLFLINDGDIFSRSKVAEGLENLREAYGEFGYINYTGVPNTAIDNEKHRIHLTVDIDEGGQFHVERVEVHGLDVATRQTLLRDSPLQGGSVYSARLDELFLGRIKSQFPECGCGDVKHNQLDEQNRTVALTYDLSSCAAGR